ncbi:MAG TPA: DUF2231 domain-containing protein [Gemmataceae bacterium]|jgi:uncharacterized membrane protein|nr:DUF2231 domain-containing protein [Gemmataceae bacterium]
MESRFKIMGHPAHQILIVFPLGLLVTAVVFDGIARFGGPERFAEMAYWMIAAGLIGGVLAAVPGWVDWYAIPSPCANLLELEFGREVSETAPENRAAHSNHLIFSGILVDRGRTAARRSDGCGLQPGYRVQPSSNSKSRAPR